MHFFLAATISFCFLIKTNLFSCFCMCFIPFCFCFWPRNDRKALLHARATVRTSFLNDVKWRTNNEECATWKTQRFYSITLAVLLVCMCDCVRECWDGRERKSGGQQRAVFALNHSWIQTLSGSWRYVRSSRLVLQHVATASSGVNFLRSATYLFTLNLKAEINNLK